MGVNEQMAATVATLQAHLKDCGDKSERLERTLDRVDAGMQQLHDRITKASEQARADRKQDIDGVLKVLSEEQSKRERLAWWAIMGALGVSGSIIMTLLMIIAFFLTGGKVEMGMKAISTITTVL